MPSKNTLSKKQVIAIKALEKRAINSTLNEIKVEDPKLYAKIIKNPKKITNADQISSATIKKLYKKAPIEQKSAKPGAEEYEDIGENAYDKYFDVE